MGRPYIDSKPVIWPAGSDVDLILDPNLREWYYIETATQFICHESALEAMKYWHQIGGPEPLEIGNYDPHLSEKN